MGNEFCGSRQSDQNEMKLKPEENIQNNKSKYSNYDYEDNLNLDKDIDEVNNINDNIINNDDMVYESNNKNIDYNYQNGNENYLNIVNQNPNSDLEGPNDTIRNIYSQNNNFGDKYSPINRNNNQKINGINKNLNNFNEYINRKTLLNTRKINNQIQNNENMNNDINYQNKLSNNFNLTEPQIKNNNEYLINHYHYNNNNELLLNNFNNENIQEKNIKINEPGDNRKNKSITKEELIKSEDNIDLYSDNTLENNNNENIKEENNNNIEENNNNINRKNETFPDFEINQIIKKENQLEPNDRYPLKTINSGEIKRDSSSEIIENYIIKHIQSRNELNKQLPTAEATCIQNKILPGKKLTYQDKVEIKENIMPTKIITKESSPIEKTIVKKPIV